MSKKNLNEVMEFISRWGESDFSEIIRESSKRTKIRDADDPSVFWTNVRPGPPIRKNTPSALERILDPILGRAMHGMGRMYGGFKHGVKEKMDKKIDPSGKIREVVKRVGSGLNTARKAIFSGVGTSLRDLLTRDSDYEYVYDEETPDESKKVPSIMAPIDQASPILPDSKNKSAKSGTTP